MPRSRRASAAAATRNASGAEAAPRPWAYNGEHGVHRERERAFRECRGKRGEVVTRSRALPSYRHVRAACLARRAKARLKKQAVGAATKRDLAAGVRAGLQAAERLAVRL